MAAKRKPVDDDRPARRLAYSPPASPDADPSTLISLVQEQGLVLRQMQIFALDHKGLSPEQITHELNKGGGGWSMELVLKLMGRDGSPDAEVFRSKYARVSAEQENHQLLDPEGIISQLQVHALQRIHDYLTRDAEISCKNPKCDWVVRVGADRDMVEVCLKVLKAAGVGLVESKSIIEHRFPDEDRKLLIQFLTDYKPAPKSRLEEIMARQSERPN